MSSIRRGAVGPCQINVATSPSMTGLPRVRARASRGCSKHNANSYKLNKSFLEKSSGSLLSITSSLASWKAMKSRIAPATQLIRFSSGCTPGSRRSAFKRKMPLLAFQFRVETAHQPVLVQDGHTIITIDAFCRGQIGFQRLVEAPKLLVAPAGPP